MRRDRHSGARSLAAVGIAVGLAARPATAQPAFPPTGDVPAEHAAPHGAGPDEAPEEGAACPLTPVMLWNDREGLVLRQVPRCLQVEHTATIRKGDPP